MKILKHVSHLPGEASGNIHSEPIALSLSLLAHTLESLELGQEDKSLTSHVGIIFDLSRHLRLKKVSINISHRMASFFVYQRLWKVMPPKLKRYTGMPRSWVDWGVKSCCTKQWRWCCEKRRNFRG